LDDDIATAQASLFVAVSTELVGGRGWEIALAGAADGEAHGDLAHDGRRRYLPGS
jgi:hypothetical protein